MNAQEKAGGGAGATPAAAAAADRVDEHIREELHRLGELLEARVGDVIARIAEYSEEAGPMLEGSVRASFERIGASSTVAVARWMAGGDPQAGLEAGKEAWNVIGQLAAYRSAPLHELTKRCLRWRDAIEDIIAAGAGELGICAAAVAQARSMVRVALDVTLVRVCKVFESERIRTEDELARRQEELAFMATHDQLTGLPNRTLILDRATGMLGRSRRHHTPVTALLINLDNFKDVNDRFGHAAGDELLQAIAARLDVVVRDTDALGRVGADEFVLLAEEVLPGASGALVAERVQQVFAEPFTIAGDAERITVMVTPSIGIAGGEQLRSAEELLRNADVAMHQAKLDGGNRHVVFETAMQDSLQSRLSLQMDLRGALARDELFLVFQPTFDLQRMTATGVEALLRWRHPIRGVVAPNDFIPLLEESGLIVEVGRWVLTQACVQAAAWRRNGHALSIAVNVSARQLDSDEFVGDVQQALAGSSLDPSSLTLEITETTLMRNAEETARRLRKIKELGVRIAIDDFGTGYSSLAHLQRFPVDALKIDRSFVSQLTDNPEGEKLIHTLVALGKSLSIETVAEGIEHPRELELLQDENCDSGQGFLFARPLDAQGVEAFLAARHAPAQLA